MWTNRIFLFLVLLSNSSCFTSVDTHPSKVDVQQTFQLFLEEAMTDSYGSIHGVSMTVIAPTLDIHWTGETGYDSRLDENELSAEQPFRIASVTKTFVAAAILRLHEMGKLSLDDPISKYISEDHIQILEKGNYEPDKITLRHCLHHTAGLFDYARGSDAFGDMVLKDRQKRWTRTEQLQLAMDLGEAVGEIGEKYEYSDTGYILAGEVIEVLMDTTLSAGLRKLVGYQNLDMNSTWLETLEAAPEGLKDMVHCYFGRTDVSVFDPSFDLYGGGGLVSTTSDLANFVHGIFNQKIYQKEGTLDLMLEQPTYANSYNPEENDFHKDYRMGLYEMTVYGEKVYAHSGLWDVFILHVPAYNCSIAVNYTNARRDRLMKKTILVIKNLIEETKK